MDTGRLLCRSLEDSFKDGNILLEDNGRHCEVSLQLVGALTEIRRQVSHILPLLHLIKKLNEAAREEEELAEDCHDIPFRLTFKQMSWKIRKIHFLVVGLYCSTGALWAYLISEQRSILVRDT